MQSKKSKSIDEVPMISELQAIKIARGYLKKESGSELPVIKASYIPGDSQEPMYVPFQGQPTWEVWFQQNVPVGWMISELTIYVDATTGEPWELNYGSPDDEPEE